jgi:hypothetical protein
MKKVKNGDIRPDYRRHDLGPGVRGKHLEAYRSGSNLVLLSPDVAEVFPTDDSVNEALRAFAHVARRTALKTGRVSKREPAGRQ